MELLGGSQIPQEGTSAKSTGHIKRRCDFRESGTGPEGEIFGRSLSKWAQTYHCSREGCFYGIALDHELQTHFGLFGSLCVRPQKSETDRGKDKAVPLDYRTRDTAKAAWHRMNFGVEIVTRGFRSFLGRATWYDTPSTLPA